RLLLVLASFLLSGFLGLGFLACGLLLLLRPDLLSFLSNRYFFPFHVLLFPELFRLRDMLIADVEFLPHPAPRAIREARLRAPAQSVRLHSWARRAEMATPRAARIRNRPRLPASPHLF